MEVVRNGQILVYFEDTCNSNCQCVKCRTWKNTRKQTYSLVEMGNTMRGKDLTQKYQLFLTVLFDILMGDVISVPGWTEHIVLSKMR